MHFIEQTFDRLHRRFNLWAIAFFALGLFGYALRSIDYFSAVPGDLGDARFNSVILEHLYRWATGQDASLLSPDFFYPFKHMLAFSDNHFGSAIFYIVLRWLGLSREAAFDGWFLIGIGLSFFCACLAFRRLGFSRLASSVGAFVFCFSLPALRLEVHAQLIYRFAVPLAFAAFWDLLANRRLPALGEVAFWSALQFFCSIYLGVFLFYLLAATLLIWLIVGEKKNFLSEIRFVLGKESGAAKISSGVLLIFSATMLIWLLYKYYSVTVEYPLKPDQRILSLLPQLAWYLSVKSRFFFGFGVCFLAVVGAVQIFYKGSLNKIGPVALGAFLLLVAVTLSIKDHSLYRYFLHLPGIAAIRAVLRIVLVMLLPIGILAAVGVDNIRKKMLTKALLLKAALSVFIFVLLGIEVVAYQPHNTPIQTWRTRYNNLLRMLPEHLSAQSILFVTYNKGDDWNWPELDGMVLAQDLGIPTINGYSGNVPYGYNIFPWSCISYRNRLLGFAHYYGLPVAAINPIARRVITLSFTPCSYEPVVGFYGAINPAQAENIVLQIADLKIGKKSLSALISVANNSSDVFYTLSPENKSVRLSWRWVPLSSGSDYSLSRPGWQVRKDLDRAIDPGQSLTIEITSELPKLAGNYFFEVSLVQENVFWFHDQGMKIARKRIGLNN